jgi:hypothetical protein
MVSKGDGACLRPCDSVVSADTLVAVYLLVLSPTCLYWVQVPPSAPTLASSIDHALVFGPRICDPVSPACLCPVGRIPALYFDLSYPSITACLVISLFYTAILSGSRYILSVICRHPDASWHFTAVVGSEFPSQIRYRS